MTDELAEWKAKASPHCLDCLEYQRACEVTGNHEALEAELAKVRAQRDEARSDALAQSMTVEALKMALAPEVPWGSSFVAGAAKIVSELTAARARIAELKAAQSLDSRFMHAKALADELDAARARIAELEAAQQWRPMATAPTFCADMDGLIRDAPVLLAFPTGHVTVAERGPRKSSKWRHHSTGNGFTREPIGWLPLPEPPKETT